ncbi:MAG: putative heme-binding domain-containing protein [Verrucomicrobiales bacterium]|jgi:putative heme-binding domain-containing protein
MKKTLLFLALVIPAAAGAEDFQNVFNGKDLTGWKGLTEFWTVKDGAIVGETTKEKPTKGNTFLVWQGGELGDFEFKCQVRFKGNNSGVQYRSKVVDEENFVLAGYQADLHPKPEYFGMLYGEKLPGRGIIAQRGQRVEVGKDGKPKVVGEVGNDAQLTDWEWNELRIVAVGDRTIHQINGVTAVDYIDHHPEAMRKGVLGLQLHAGGPMTVEFKSVQLRKLTGDDAAATLKAAVESKAPPAAAAKLKEPAKATDYGWVSGGKKPDWIWRKDQPTSNDPIFLRKKFWAPSKVGQAPLYMTCDNGADLFINGKKVGTAKDWGSPVMTDVRKFLQGGDNVIAVRAHNRGGVAAFVLKLYITGITPETTTVLSDPSWKMSLTSPEGWQTLGFDDSAWNEKLKSMGKFGIGPWGLAGINKPGGGGGGGGGDPLDAERITVPDGFKVEMLYEVPKAEQGSWVSLTVDPKGRLLASDQGDKGLYRITVAEHPEKPQVDVERMPVDISGAQGMTWAFDGLYFNKSGGNLHRIVDSNGDDKLDKLEVLPSATGGGEHGNHAVIPTEDGKALYVVGGNHTNLPPEDAISGSRVQGWDEDLLLPREWDANGHARGRLAPGGWVSRYDPETKKHDIICTGFRNQYDIALNKYGDMFTYDADMEWDLGTPWYRPTRICQVGSGVDFGWRSGSGKWPNYYEDSMPPTVDIGPGCPTGVVAGLGTKFPAKYQDALYALDWTFGTIYAIHMTPDGAGYQGESEPFCFGAPLPVTDAIVGNDGALYFTIGGRNTQSALFRVTYVGDESTAPIAAAEPNEAVKTRRKLEKFHDRENAKAVETAWPHLASEDRWVRHAARVAIESQPVDSWEEKIFDDDSQTRITSCVALARAGNEKHRASILAALLELNPKDLPEQQLLGLLRAYALDFTRLGKPTEAEREQIISEIDPLLPSKSVDVNTELVRVLVYLNAPGIVEKTTALLANVVEPEAPDWHELASRNASYGGRIIQMLDNPPPSKEINYAFMLRNVKRGWTIEQRRIFVEFINAAAKHPGGNSYGKFLTNLRDEVLGNCTNEERAALADITGENFNPVPDFEITPPKGPGEQWTVDSAAAHANRGKFKQASFESGRNLFHAVGCAACHRFDGLGGDLGPDLTTVKNKFDERYMLESIIDPSSTISDQYGSSIVTLKDGKTVMGLVVERGDTIDIYPPLAEAKATTVKATDVVKVEQSPVSQMPPALINSLNPDEIRDLIAYLMSGGNPKDRLYGK